MYFSKLTSSVKIDDVEFFLTKEKAMAKAIASIKASDGAVNPFATGIFVNETDKVLYAVCLKKNDVTLNDVKTGRSSAQWKRCDSLIFDVSVFGTIDKYKIKSL